MEWMPVAIVAILVWGGISAYKIKLGIISDEDGNETRIIQADQSIDAASRSEVAQLKERIQVLERLVTDRGFTLSDEIEALRTTRTATNESGVPLNMNTKTKA